MIRRSIRIAFRIGILAGVAFALFKLVQSRRGPSPFGGSEWASSPGPPTAGLRARQTPPAQTQPKLVPGREPDGQGDEVAPGGTEAEPTGLAPTDESPDGVAGQAPAEPLGDNPASPSATRRATGSAKQATATKKRTARTAKSPAKSPARAWVEPKGSFCPSSHPIKAKLKSGIFHLPGMLAYERTRPDRCYKDERAAEGDGLRKAKR